MPRVWIIARICVSPACGATPTTAPVGQPRRSQKSHKQSTLPLDAHTWAQMRAGWALVQRAIGASTLMQCGDLHTRRSSAPGHQQMGHYLEIWLRRIIPASLVCPTVPAILIVPAAKAPIVCILQQLGGICGACMLIVLAEAWHRLLAGCCILHALNPMISRIWSIGRAVEDC